MGWGLAGIRGLKGPRINVRINTGSCWMAESMSEPGRPGRESMQCPSWSPSCSFSRRGGGEALTVGEGRPAQVQAPRDH